MVVIAAYVRNELDLLTSEVRRGRRSDRAVD